jgi:hypothetical protein
VVTLRPHEPTRAARGAGAFVARPSAAGTASIIVLSRYLRVPCESRCLTRVGGRVRFLCVSSPETGQNGIVYYRSPRGGQLPAALRTKKAQREFLRLYALMTDGHRKRPTMLEVCGTCGISTSQGYRALMLLGVRPQSERGG